MIAQMTATLSSIFAITFNFEVQFLLEGAVRGLTFAALAAGFVLIYRSTGVLNFAHAEVGAVGLAIFVYLLVEVNLNWWFSFALALVAGAMISMIVELVVVRRLFASPRLVLLIATIGVAQLLQAIRFNFPQAKGGGPIPLPFSTTFGERGDLIIVRPRDYMIILVIPLLIGLVALFLNRTKYGLAVRATASNADTARIYGTSPKTTSTIVWSLAGVLATATAVVIAPIEQIGVADVKASNALAAPLLLRAITVGLLARMQSLPKVLVGGLAVGIVERLIRANVDSAEAKIIFVYLFLAVLAIVLFVGRGRTDDASWSLSAQIDPIPTKLKSVWWIKHMNLLGFGLLFGALGSLGFILQKNSSYFVWTNILTLAIVGVSLSLLTGWAGQLSLGHFALFGVGAVTMIALTSGNTIPLIERGVVLEWGVALVVAVILGTLTAVAVGLPALRVKGLFLAVTTLAFAVATSEWVFRRDVVTGGQSSTRAIPKPVFGPIDLDSRRAYYFFVLLCLAGVCALVSQLRRTGVGRSLIAVRENEEAAATATISPNRVKLMAFALSGGIASFAGALFITAQPGINPATAFAPQESLQMVAIAIIGGLGSVAGPILGALWVEGLPAAWGDNPPQLILLLSSSIGLLLLLMYFPGGIAQLVYSARNALIRWADDRYPDLPPEPRTAAPTLPARARKVVELSPGQPALSTSNVSVQFGGNRAVDNVSFNVMPGELVGLIGTNGAGKSTLLNAVSGFVPSTGSVEVLGKKVDGLAAHKRHELGLGRGFQAAKLFPDLTIRETLMVALEAREKTLLVPSMLALPPSPRAERTKRSEADEIIDFLGLGAFADSDVSGLSTGTRRIVELGNLLAVDAQVLLLDEPTGGVAQKETEAFGPLIRNIQQELDAAVVVIEHDMPLVMSISDRVYCLEAGAVIAEGSPEAVRNDPMVISSYLGTDDRAINRSDQASTSGDSAEVTSLT